MSMPSAQSSSISKKPNSGNPCDSPSHGTQKNIGKPRLFKRLPISILPLVIYLLGSPSAHAGIMDWISARNSKTSSTAQKKKATKPQRIFAVSKDEIPSFFSSASEADVTGKNLDLLKFSEIHWANNKKNLQRISKELSSKLVNSKCSDITNKLLVINVQMLRESLKSSASGIRGLAEGSDSLEKLVADLIRIISAPNQETLKVLQGTIVQTKQANDSQKRSAMMYISACESLISLSGESYQTLELIPKLSIDPIDLYLLGSKQIVRKIKSNGEALKGFLLNIQDGCDQINNDLEMLQNTISSTLRFSDHFAFSQYPLINLPVPSREKLFSQAKSLQNSLKGINNTLSIGDSQVKNTAQQLTTLIQEISSKIRDVLRFQSNMDLSSGDLPQILSYTQNQVSGLYQRTQEGLSGIRRTVAQQPRKTNESGNVRISVESADERITRKVANSIGDSLPLFLLGSKKSPATQKVSSQTSPPAEAPREEMKVLYSDQEENSWALTKLRPVEEDLLKKEINDSFFSPQKESLGSSIGESYTDLGTSEVFDSIGPQNSHQSASLEKDLEKEVISKNSLSLEANPSDFELLRIESLGEPYDSVDLIPMPKLSPKH